MIQKLSSQKLPAACARIANSADLPKLEFAARFIDSVDELDSLQPEWDRLMDAAIHRNLMFDPDFLIPAFKHFADQSVRILVVEAPRKNDPNGPAVICALLPVQTKRIYGLPVSALEIWAHNQCVDSTPLLRYDCAKEVLNFLFDFLGESERTTLLSLNTVANHGQWADVLTDVLHARELQAFQRASFSRACFRPEVNAEAYFQWNVSSGVQKNQRRLARRLEEQGKVTVSVDCDAKFSHSLIEDFLRLESSGWKTAAGSAMKCVPSSEQFFREMVTRSMHHDKVSFLSVKLNGEPISMLCDLNSGRMGYAFKTAFDDTMKEYSPGMMAELRNIEYLHDTDVICVDSCTAPGNETMNRVWGSRLRFQSLVIPLRGKISQWAVAFMPLMQQFKKRMGK